MFLFLFIPTLMCIYLSFHIYFSFFKNNILILPVIAIITFSIVFSLIWLHKIYLILPSPLFNIIQFIVYFLMGVGLYAFTLYIISDILRVFITINPFKEGIIILSAALLIASLGYINTRVIRISNQTIYSYKVAQPITIALVSDLHIGSADITMNKMKSMVAKINSQNPDIVIMAGDIVDNASIPFDTLGYGSLLQDIKSKYGVYAIMGNHETYHREAKKVMNPVDSETYYEDIQKIIEKFTKFNIIVLHDSESFLKNLNLNLIGFSDKGRALIKHPITINDFKIDTNKFNLLIEHNPKRFPKNAANNIDLQVSGHTHAGQIIHGYLLEKFIYEKSWGLLEKGDSKLITSSGVGSWGPPIRDVTYPEIVIITIKPENKHMADI